VISRRGQVRAEAEVRRRGTEADVRVGDRLMSNRPESAKTASSRLADQLEQDALFALAVGMPVHLVVPGQVRRMKMTGETYRHDLLDGAADAVLEIISSSARWPGKSVAAFSASDIGSGWSRCRPTTSRENEASSDERYQRVPARPRLSMAQ